MAAHNWIMVCACVLQKHCLLQLDNLSQVKKGKLCSLVLGKDLGFFAFLISLADPLWLAWLIIQLHFHFYCLVTLSFVPFLPSANTLDYFLLFFYCYFYYRWWKWSCWMGKKDLLCFISFTVWACNGSFGDERLVQLIRSAQRFGWDYFQNR